MAVFLSPVGGVAAQFFDNSGNVLTGGKIYTYSAGTTTDQATYTSANGVTFHSNPIILDASGRVPGGEIWLADGVAYKFVIEDSNNVLIGTYDNIVGINSNFLNFYTQEETQTATQGQTVFTLATISYPPGTNSLIVFVNGSKQISGVNYAETDSTTVTFASGLNVGDIVDFTTAVAVSGGATNASNVIYNPAGVGAVATTVQTKLRETVSVKDFGATGDGTTNDTAAFTAALSASNSVYVPPGTYAVSQIVFQNVTGKTLFGASNGSSVIKGIAVGTSIIRFGGPTVGTNRALLCNLKNLSIQATAAYTYAIECQFMTDANFTDIFVNGTNITTGLYLDNSWDNHYYNIYITGCPNGISCGPTSPNNNSFFGGRLSGDVTGVGIDVSGAGNNFYGMDISSYTVGILTTSGIYGMTVSGCYFEGNNKDILFGNSGGIFGSSITGNIFAVGAGSNYGIDYAATSPSSGVVVSGNVFRFKAIAINLGAAFIGWDVTTNSYDTCTLDVNGFGTNTAYEASTWTPAIATGGGSVTTSSVTGKYTKIKKMVTLQATLVLSGISTPSGVLTITGLPYANGTQVSAVSIIVNNLGTNPISGYVNPSDNKIVLYKTVAGVLTNAGGDLTATTTIYVSATYETA